MYRSTDAQGNPVAVTGTYIEPDVPWPGNGPRPLLAYRDCLRGGRAVRTVAAVQPGHPLFPKGFRPDVERRGGLDRDAAGPRLRHRGHRRRRNGHPRAQSPQWLNREAAGTAMLDAARAAMKLPDTSLDPHGPVAFWGFMRREGRLRCRRQNWPPPTHLNSISSVLSPGRPPVTRRRWPPRNRRQFPCRAPGA